MPDFIVLEPAGRLGNRLQTSAYSLAYAAEYHLKVFLLCLDGFEACFKGSRKNFGCSFPVVRFRLAGAKLFRRFFRDFVETITVVCERFPYVRRFLRFQILEGSKAFPVVLDSPEIHEQIRSHRLTIIKGYYIYCSPELLVKHRQPVTAFFEPTGGTYAESQKTVKCLKQEFDLVIGVHIRHGDYKEYADGEHFYTFDEYLNWMTSLCENEKGRYLYFVVCSDADLSQCDFDGVSWGPGPGSFLEDMYVLAACDYIMGPFSTYNRWSAFYGKIPRLELLRQIKDISLRDFSPVEDLTYMAPRARR